MLLATVFGLLNLILLIFLLGGFIYLFILLIKALRKYLRSGEADVFGSEVWQGSNLPDLGKHMVSAVEKLR